MSNQEGRFGLIGFFIEPNFEVPHVKYSNHIIPDHNEEMEKEEEKEKQKEDNEAIVQSLTLLENNTYELIIIRKETKEKIEVNQFILKEFNCRYAFEIERINLQMVRKTGLNVNLFTLDPIFINPGQLCLAFKFLRNGDLSRFHYCWCKSQLSTTIKLRFLLRLFKLILLDLQLLHNHRIAHFDLKPENIMTTDEFLTLIIDFGLSQYCPNGKTRRVLQGTPNYIAPELKNEALLEINPFQADIYSLGVTFYKFLLPIQNQSQEYIPLWKLIYEMTMDNPYLRLDVSVILENILFSNEESMLTIPEFQKIVFDTLNL